MANLTIAQLSKASNVHRNTISALESDRSMPNHSTIAALRKALEEAGVEFIEENGGGPGVRLRKPV